MENYPLIMTEEYWANSMFSIARYMGEIEVNGHRYRIVNKEGVDVFALSAKQTDDNEMVIPPNEPCDLVLTTLITSYKKLGRERILQAVRMDMTENEIKKYAKSGCKTLLAFKQWVCDMEEKKLRKRGEL